VEEADFNKGLKDVAKLRKAMTDSDKALALMKKQQDDNKKAIAGLTQLNLQLNAQLANVGPNDVATNNKLVAAINANVSQVKLLSGQTEDIEKQVQSSRGKANEAREAYIQAILDLRKTADAISEKYKSLASDEQVKTAVQQLEQASGKTYELTESRSFASAVRKLKSLEDTVLSESIDLRKDGGTFYVSVVVDGKHTQEMIVDSGSSLICLPQKIAADCGVQVKSGDPEITLQLADGSKIKGHLVSIPSVRVGKFTVENVACAVLGPEAVDAPPLLGMSFLENFKFELHAQDSKLTMVKVDSEESGR
jgi:aspartyl protease family protein